LLGDDASVPAALLQVIAERLRDASRRQFEFGTSDALGRLCASLIELDERYGRDDRGVRVLDLPFAQAELAALAGLSREAIVKNLAALRNLEWVAVERRTVTILDAGALRSRGNR
jgi:CRP/FNR family transcriptional regulator, cyclic AMP receptor protein